MEMRDHIIENLLDELRARALENAALKARLALKMDELQEVTAAKQELESTLCQMQSITKEG